MRILLLWLMRYQKGALRISTLKNNQEEQPLWQNKDKRLYQFTHFHFDFYWPIKWPIEFHEVQILDQFKCHALNWPRTTARTLWPIIEASEFFFGVTGWSKHAQNVGRWCCWNEYCSWSCCCPTLWSEVSFAHFTKILSYPIQRCPSTTKIPLWLKIQPQDPPLGESCGWRFNYVMSHMYKT